MTDEIASERESLVANAIRSVVAIPLRCQSSPTLLGLLYLDSHYQNPDFIVLVTDGITEAEDAEGTQFGVAKLHDLISAQDPVASVFSAVEQFCEGASLLDDQTMLVIQQVA